MLPFPWNLLQSEDFHISLALTIPLMVKTCSPEWLAVDLSFTVENFWRPEQLIQMNSLFCIKYPHCLFQMYLSVFCGVSDVLRSGLCTNSMDSFHCRLCDHALWWVSLARKDNACLLLNYVHENDLPLTSITFLK